MAPTTTNLPCTTTTRRKIITGLTGILASSTAPAYITKSLVACRENVSHSDNESIPTAADYVQDGLLAIFDGIENAGWGTHIDTLTEWADLIGGTPCTVNYCFIEENGIRFPSASSWRIGRGGTFNRIFPWENSTFEVVCSGIAPTTFTSFLFQSGCETNRDPSVAIAYTGGKIITLMYHTGSGGTSYYDGANGMLGGTYSVTTGSDMSSFSLFRNGTQPEYAGLGRWNIQQGWSSCLAYRGTDTSQNSFYEVTVHSIRVYSRPLTPEELAYNFSIDKIRFPNIPD